MVRESTLSYEVSGENDVLYEPEGAACSHAGPDVSLAARASHHRLHELIPLSLSERGPRSLVLLMGTIFGQAGVHADPEGVRYFEYRIPSGLPG